LVVREAVSYLQSVPLQKTCAKDGVLTITEVKSSCENIVITLEIASLERFAHDDLRFSFSIVLSDVEEVGAVIPGLLETLSSLLDFCDSSVGTECSPASQSKDRDLQPGISEISKEHALGLERLSC
jgi:hypothetical protein